MIVAPIGVFARIADTITSIAQDNLGQIIKLLAALGYYCIVVLLGLAIQMLLVYALLFKTMAKLRSIRSFLAGIAPAHLVGFSSSSSPSTLPVTMECYFKNLS